MKICIDVRPVQNANKVRGIGVLMNNLLTEMGRQAGDDDEFILITQQGSEPPRWFEREKRIKTFRPERPNRFNWLADQLFLPSIVKRSGAQVFLGTDFNSYLVPPRGVRVVSLLYDVIPLLFPEVLAQQPFSIRIGWPLNFRKLRRSDRLLAISQATRTDAIKLLYLDPDAVSVAYPGIDHGLFCPGRSGDLAEQQRVRQRYGITGDFFVYVGDTDWRKNLTRMLEAFERVSGEVSLVLAGKRAAQDQAVAGMIRQLGLEARVILTGFVPEEDLPPLYGSALGLLFPSLYEGFGIPVAEAMACGCPVITSTISSLPEVAGDAALLVNPESVVEIIGAMERIRDDRVLRERMKVDGIRHAAKFSWQCYGAEVLEALRNWGV